MLSSKFVYFVYLLSVNGRGISTSELHVQVRIEDKVHCIYSQFSHLHSPLAAVHVHVVIAYICSINDA